MRRLHVLRAMIPVLLILLLVSPSEAVRFFTSGFEENNITANEVIWSGTINGAGTVQTTTVHSGTYAF